MVKTRNTESMPMPMIIMTFLVSAQWYIYGQMLHDKFMMVIFKLLLIYKEKHLDIKYLINKFVQIFGSCGCV